MTIRKILCSIQISNRRLVSGQSGNLQSQISISFHIIYDLINIRRSFFMSWIFVNGEYLDVISNAVGQKSQGIFRTSVTQ